jgi:hypothetical protein
MFVLYIAITPPLIAPISVRGFFVLR